MNIIITDWALNSYLELLGEHFTRDDYLNILRPDAELLREYRGPHHPLTPRKFGNPKFWGPCKDSKGIISGGYKMKWHNMGPGRIQLRLLVAITSDFDSAYLCQAYVKTGDARDRREMAKMKSRILRITDGEYTYRGELP